MGVSYSADTVPPHTHDFLEACRGGKIADLRERAHELTPEFLEHAVGGYSMSGLHIACEKGHSDVVRLLLRCGANPVAISSRNNTPLHVAARSNRPACVRALLGHLNVGWLKARLLWIAHCKPQPPECLIARLPRDMVRLVALRVLSDFGSARQLREALGQVNMDGRTALEYALQKGASDVVPLLINPVTALQMHGFMGSPLIYAATRGSLQGVQRMLELRANVNCRNERRETPLYRACCAYPEQHEVVQLLLDYGADKSIRSTSGKTALQEAEARHYVRSCEALK